MLLVASHLSVTAMTFIFPVAFAFLGYAVASKARPLYWYAVNVVLASLLAAHAAIMLTSAFINASWTIEDSCMNRWLGLAAEYPGDRLRNAASFLLPMLLSSFHLRSLLLGGAFPPPPATPAAQGNSAEVMM